MTKLSALALAASLSILASAPSVARADEQDFFKLDNPTDLAFNQLLGINNHRIIVGYYGDGNLVANVGYSLLPPTHYAIENFKALPSGQTVAQLQSIGINNQSHPAIVGFVTGSDGNTHGFIDVDGVQALVDDPKGVLKGAPSTQNLLGINDLGQAAGFYLDANGNSHGFIAGFGWDKNHHLTQGFREVDFPGATATQASGVNNNDEVCGFYTLNGVNHGFYGPIGRFQTVDVKINGMNVTGTMILGCNNQRQFVGVYTAQNGSTTTTHGFIFDGQKFVNYDAKGSSQTAAFNVQGTTINGINDNGDVVGFFSDGANVNGFVKYR